jgi:two-component system cell cycle response regulator
MSGEIILVVDDNPTNVKLVKYLLEKRGYAVSVAGNATEAMAVLESTLPELILMDIQLPGIDGLELTRKIKAENRLNAIPIVAVTAYAMKGDEQRAREAGCEGYVTKPIDTRKLPDIVRGYIDRVSGSAEGT